MDTWEVKEAQRKKLVRKRVLQVICGVIGFIAFCFLMGTFTIIPAGHRGVVLWWGSVENRIMPEGLNFKVPFAEKVVKMDIRVQPHQFKAIEAASMEYQDVKLCGMMNYHLEAANVNRLYQTVGRDFASKVIDPAFNDFVKEVTPLYKITEILPKREEIRRIALEKLQKNLERYGIIIDDIYFSNISFSPTYMKAIDDKQVAQQRVETEKQILEQQRIKAQQKIVDSEGRAKSIKIEAQGQAEANELIQKSLTPKLVEYKAIEKWNGTLPQITGGATPFVSMDINKK